MTVWRSLWKVIKMSIFHHVFIPFMVFTVSAAKKRPQKVTVWHSLWKVIKNEFRLTIFSLFSWFYLVWDPLICQWMNADFVLSKLAVSLSNIWSNIYLISSNTFPNRTQGQVKISLGSTITNGLKAGRYSYDLLLNDGSTKTRVVEGSALVTAGVTTT